MSDFEILGIQSGFSEGELKKAYAKKACEHPPEINPEIFEHIWKAYDNLSDALEILPVFDDEDTLNKYMPLLKQIQKLKKSGDSERLYALCKDVSAKNPESLQLIYETALSQIYLKKFDESEQTVKALMERKPDDINLLITLACIYIQWDKMKKFTEVMEKLLCMNDLCDADFMLFAASYTYSNDNIPLFRRISGRFIREPLPISPQNMDKALSLFSHLVQGSVASPNNACTYGSLDQMPVYFLNFLHVNCKYISGNMPMCCNVVNSIGVVMGYKGKTLPQPTWQAIRLMRQMCQNDDEIKEVYFAKICCLADNMSLCKEFDEEFVLYCRTLIADIMHQSDDDDDEFSRFDCQMCMLLDRKHTLQQIEKTKNDYAEIYELLSDWKAALTDSVNIESTRMKITQQFNAFPESQRNDSMYMKKLSKSHEPMRKIKKIGRNDPCPCGSGKKYKKCCGR